MSYMISTFAKIPVKMAFVNITNGQQIPATAGTYQITFSSIQQSNNMALSISAGGLVLEAGRYMCYYKYNCRTYLFNREMSFITRLTLDNVDVSQLPVFCEKVSGTTNNADSSVSIGNAFFTANNGQILRMSITTSAGFVIESFSTWAGLSLIKMDAV